ncbi:BA75_03842T0 [Komagataella pastoris]|uniref:BA75_03842T0 n=1 Tax=Komagataella pastoris TaxID=4922 RepID=A0A1B2JG39_PICPA|nr:BA75_03842T0 [Komagataella pastoris]
MKLKKVKKTSVLALQNDSDEEKDEETLMREHLKKENERNALKVDILEKKVNYDIDEPNLSRQSNANQSNSESKFISNLLKAKKQRENDQILLQSFKSRKETESSVGERIETSSFKIYKEEIKELEEKALHTQEKDETDPDSKGLLTFYRTQLDYRENERSTEDIPLGDSPHSHLQHKPLEVPTDQISQPNTCFKSTLTGGLNIMQEIDKAELDLLHQKQSKLLSLLPPPYDQHFLDEAKQRYFQRQKVSQ